MMKKWMYALLAVMCATALQAGVQAQLRQGGKLYKQEKYGSALNVYNTILKSHPTEQRVLFNAGDAYYRLHEYTQAQEAYTQAAKLTDSVYSQHALYNLGNAYYKAGDTQKAMDAYKKAILQNPQDKEAAHNLQLLLEQENQSKNKNDQNQENSQSSSDNQSSQNQDEKGNEPHQPQQTQPKPGAMSQQDADRVMAMAKENEYKSGAASSQAPEQLVEKDW